MEVQDFFISRMALTITTVRPHPEYLESIKSCKWFTRKLLKSKKGKVKQVGKCYDLKYYF